MLEARGPKADLALRLPSCCFLLLLVLLQLHECNMRSLQFYPDRVTLLALLSRYLCNTLILLHTYSPRKPFQLFKFVNFQSGDESNGHNSGLRHSMLIFWNESQPSGAILLSLKLTFVFEFPKEEIICFACMKPSMK